MCEMSGSGQVAGWHARRREEIAGLSQKRENDWCVAGRQQARAMQKSLSCINRVRILRAGIEPARLWRVHQNARHGQPYP